MVELQTLISAATVNANGDQADPMDSEHSEVRSFHFNAFRLTSLNKVVSFFQCCKDSRHCALIQRTPSSENGVDLAALNENDQVRLPVSQN